MSREQSKSESLRRIASALIPSSIRRNLSDREYLRLIAKGVGRHASGDAAGRVSSLDGTELVVTGCVVETVGTPAYVSDPSAYAAYGITVPGWYVFARVTGRGGAPETVTGADGCVLGASYVDVAVRFEVAAMSKQVHIAWADGSDWLTFRATDLAVRNLDYRTTFYIYDLDPFATWTWSSPVTSGTFASGKNYYVQRGDRYVKADVTSGASVYVEVYEHSYVAASDASFVGGKAYYVLDGGGYVAAEVTTGDYLVPYEDSYSLTEDETFQDKTYYIRDDGAYVEASGMLVGDPVPADTYYEHSYVATSDTEYADGKAYYVRNGDTYTPAEVTAGDAIPTYYVDAYSATSDVAFADGKTYYKLSGSTYVPMEATAGDPVHETYYTHTKLTLEGMARNVTYKLDTVVDCPIEVVLPAIPDNGYGAWYELQMRYDGEYSMTLAPPTGVKAATDSTPKQNAGINIIDLHYASVADHKVWRLINTHFTYAA